MAANSFFTPTSHTPSLAEFDELRKTNELGWILQDAAFSYVDVTELTQNAGACGCPTFVDVCLGLPFDLCDDKFQNITVPLVDTKTGEPFLLTKGTILEHAIVGKPPHARLRPDALFVLGTIAEDPDCDDPTRFVTQADPIKGALINEVEFVKLDISKHKVSAPLFDALDTYGIGALRKTYDCKDNCACPASLSHPNEAAASSSSYSYDDNVTSTWSNISGGGATSTSASSCCFDDEEVPYDPIAAQPAAAGANMVLGETDNALVSITLRCGALKKGELFVTLRMIKAREGGACDFGDAKQGGCSCSC